MTHRPAKGTALLVAAIGLALVVTSCGGGGNTSGGDTGGSASATTIGPGDPTAGKQVYGDYCAACHGRDFEGSVQGPSHLDAHFDPATTTDQDYRNAIHNGVEESAYDFGDMPAIRSLDDQQIADVIAYIRSVQKKRGFNPD